jgi:hypothetical protein
MCFYRHSRPVRPVGLGGSIRGGLSLSTLPESQSERITMCRAVSDSLSPTTAFPELVQSLPIGKEATVHKTFVWSPILWR